MLEDAPKLTMTPIDRHPTAQQVAAFKGILDGSVQSGHLIDAMGDKLNGRGALDASIKPLALDQSKFVGVAVTCDCGPADNLGFFGALEMAQPGDVIVIATDGFRETAVIGDMVMGMARNKGVVAAVTDGMARDTDGILGVGLPCFCAGTTPNSPAREGPGAAGQMIVCGGRAIESGDLIVGDRDGVVTVPYDEIDRIIERLGIVLAAEKEMEALVKGGLTRPGFLDGVLG